MALDDILVITRRNQRPRNNSQQRIDGYSTTLSGSTNGIIREGQLYLSSLPVQSGFKMKRFLFFDRPSAARLSIIERSTHRFTFLPLFTFQPWITLFRRQNNVTGLNLSVRDTRRFVLSGQENSVVFEETSSWSFFSYQSKPRSISVPKNIFSLEILCDEYVSTIKERRIFLVTWYNWTNIATSRVVYIPVDQANLVAP